MLLDNHTSLVLTQTLNRWATAIPLSPAFCAKPLPNSLVSLPETYFASSFQAKSQNKTQGAKKIRTKILPDEALVSGGTCALRQGSRLARRSLRRAECELGLLREIRGGQAHKRAARPRRLSSPFVNTPETVMHLLRQKVLPGAGVSVRKPHDASQLFGSRDCARRVSPQARRQKSIPRRSRHANLLFRPKAAAPTQTQSMAAGKCTRQQYWAARALAPRRSSNTRRP